jgi:hypothetical protein
MSINKRDFFIFTIALLIGYLGYPALHNDQHKNINTVKTSMTAAETNVDSDTTIPINTFTEHLDLAATQQNLPTEYQQKTTHKTDELKYEQNSPEAKDVTHFRNIAKDKELDPEQQILQDELNNWTTKHKEKLWENLTNNLPIGILDDMLGQVEKDNSFLNEPTLKQDPITDEEWAYVMEQELRDFIQRHALSNNIVLFDVACKQLTCELSGNELQAGTWHQVFISLFTYLIQSGKPLDNEKGKNLSYQGEDGLIYFYSQFVMKAN